MPLYEYYCDCGKTLEAFRPMDKRHDVLCPDCGSALHIRISLQSPHQAHITLTVVDGDGRVIGKRFDHHRTPDITEYYPKQVFEEAQYNATGS